MNRIQKSAHIFIKEHKITLNNISSEKFLTQIALKQGYRVYKFSDFQNDKLISRLNIGEQHIDSFTYTENNFKCIFIKQLDSDKRMAALLLHELAHIHLCHMSNEILADSDEVEADLLVTCIWEGLSERSKKTVLKYAAIPSFIFLMLFALYAINISKAYESDTSEVFPADATVLETQFDELQSVYVTRMGKKYHRASCRHIKNRETIEVSISEAENAGYTPCLDCFQ